MSGNRIFVDTNILLYFLNGDHEVIEMIRDKDIVISFVTELEMLSFPALSLDSEKIIKELLKNCMIVEMNPEIKDLTIGFRKKCKIKLPTKLLLPHHFIINSLY